MGEKPRFSGTSEIFVIEKEKLGTNEGEKSKSETNDSPGFDSLPRGEHSRVWLEAIATKSSHY